MIKSDYKGAIFLFNNNSKKSWYSKLQHFFTGYKYSHTSMGLGLQFNDIYVLSSDKLCYVQPLYKYLMSDDIYMEVYRFKLLDDEADDIINRLVLDYSGREYGYTQILWFVYRWFCEKFLKKDVRKKHNWFAENTIVCSELTYFYLKELSIVYRLHDLRAKLDEWHSSNIHVGDIKLILDSFPTYFERIV